MEELTKMVALGEQAEAARIARRARRKLRLQAARAASSTVNRAHLKADAERTRLKRKRKAVDAAAEALLRGEVEGP